MDWNDIISVGLAFIGFIGWFIAFEKARENGKLIREVQDWREGIRRRPDDVEYTAKRRPASEAVSKVRHARAKFFEDAARRAGL